MAESIIKETKDMDTPLLKYYQNDLYDIDKDIIDNDAVPGDEYIWSIKGSGHGTDLYRLTGDVNMPYLIGNAGENGRYFHIKVTDIGKGDITPVTRDRALEFSETKANPNRVPRRQNYYKAMESLIGLKHGHSITNFSIANNFYPNEGAVSVMKVAPIRQGVMVYMSQIKADTDDGNLGKTFNNAFDNQHLNLDSATKKESTFHRIKTPREGFAIIEDITERQYKNALKKIDKSLTADVNPSP
jgi:hypothetical protein